ncbi:MAG: glycosyltransferase family 4 protein [Phycisphaeraceae bacterium]|nr:glycosyltransferase family 4 protein [Phycisphaeraceae bacterium]
MGETAALRVLHLVCGEHERGGMQKHVLDLTAAQRAAGDTPALAAHPSFGEFVAPGVELIPLDTARSRRDASLREDVRAVIARWKPDVVHAHAGKASAVVASLLPLDCATVSTVHGLKRDLRAPARFDRVIAVSEFAARRLPEGRCVVVLNGADPARPGSDTPATLAGFFGGDGGDGNDPIAIAVGRLAPVKGFDTAIRAWARVERGRLLIVGDGPERARLERLVRRHGLGGRVAFAGTRADGGALISRAALLVAPSQREGFPYVVVEALLARVPIVTTTTSGASPMIPGPFLVAPGRPKRLAAAVRRALDDPQGARREFAPVFARASEELTLAGMAKGTRDVYLKAIAHARTRTP